MTDKIDAFIIRHKIIFSLGLLAVFIAMLPVTISVWEPWYSITMSTPGIFILAMILGVIIGTYIYYVVFGFEEIGIKGGKQGWEGLFK